MDSILNGRDRTIQTRLLFDHCNNRNRGDTISYSEIETVITEKHATNGYRTVVCKWRKMMVEKRGIYPVNVRGVGYMLPDHDGQMDQGAVTHVRRATRAWGKGIVIAAVADPEKMSDCNRLQRDFLLTSGRVLHEQMKATRKLASPVVEPHRSLPTIPKSS